VVAKQGDDTEGSKGLKSGRKPVRTISGGQKGTDNGEGDPMQLKFSTERYPNIRALLQVQNPVELEERFGIVIDRDLPWPESQHKSQSYRAAAILESLARRGLKKKGKR
jgi:hypothetical protein